MSAQLLAKTGESDSSVVPDRRFGERKPCRTSGMLYAQGYSPMRIRTVDMSKKGIAVLLPQAVPDGTICDLYFHLHINGLIRKFTAKVEISNSVFRCSDVRAGCRFLALDEESQQILREFTR